MPNDKVLAQKKEVVAQLKEKISGAVAGVFVDYRGLTVEQDTKLRNELRKGGVEYKVVKNTLTRFAVSGTDYESLDPLLHGPTSMALSFDDAVAPAKILSEFSKKNAGFDIKAGFISGKVINANEIGELAELPPREVLIAKVLGGFNAPISGLANVLSANLRGLVVALNAIAEQKQSA